MNGFLPLTDGPSTAYLFNLAWQSLIIMGAAWGVSRTLRSKSIPLRRAVLVGALIALTLLPAVSALYHTSDISWNLTALFNADPSGEWTDGQRPASNPALPGSEADTSAARDKSKIAPNRASVSETTRAPAYPTPAKKLFPSAETMNILIVVWLAGAAALLVRLVYGWLFLLRLKRNLVRLRDSRVTRIVKTACSVLGIRFRPAVYTSRILESPVTFGLLTPRLVLPAALHTTLTDDELRSIVVHELAHLSHKDLAIGILQRSAAIGFWWNPFVHAVNRDLAVRMEEVCDNRAAGESKGPLGYAECLVSLAEKIHPARPIPGTVGIGHPRWSLEERIRALLARTPSMATALRPRAARALGLYFAVALFLVAGCQIFAKNWEDENWTYVTFRTSRPAPDRFDGWTFFWEVPHHDPSAAFDYVVLDQREKRYCTYHKKFGWHMGAPTRSDFAEDFYGGDPAVLFGSHIYFRIRVAAGSMRFSSPEDFHFAFYEKDATGRIDRHRPIQTINALAETSELEAAAVGAEDLSPTLHVEGGDEGCSVTFLTARNAPDHFDGWTFYWRGPEREFGARLGYVVTDPRGEEYFTHRVRGLGYTQCVRSDFSPGFAGGDPSVFFGDQIRFTFHVDKGSIDFPWYMAFYFAFYENGPDGKIDRNRPLDVIRAKVKEQS